MTEERAQTSSDHISSTRGQLIERAVPFFRAIMLELERRRRALGFPMDRFSEYAGLPDRYFSKALHVDRPSGRQANWQTLDLVVQALFPAGFDVEIRPRPGAVITASNMKARLLQLRALDDPKSQRQLMSELGRKGGERSGESRRRAARERKQRSERAAHAARMRWRTPKVTEIRAKPAKTK